MKRDKLFSKYYKSTFHDYEIRETLSYTDDTGRIPDVCFVYSGRNRGKSFEIASQLLADAWYDGKNFAYIRRYDATNFDIEDYFADKHDFISDMTDGKYSGITRDRGKLYFYGEEEDEESGDIKRIKGPECGRFFSVSRQANVKSLQFPKIYNAIYEEVLTDGTYISAEPEKTMNLYSTLRRNKEGFRLWLISNTVSVVNPYSAAWGIQLSRIKPGEVHLSKLYLKTIGKDGKEEYLLIAAHYLQDKDKLTKEELKEKRNRIKTAIASNTWDELHLFPTLPIKYARQFKIEETVVFEYDDMMMQGDIINLPVNAYDSYLYSTDEDPIPLLEATMPTLYIRRKTTEPHPGTRIYTNNPNRYGEQITMGFKEIYVVDKAIRALLDRGWVIGADNLTMNDFQAILDNVFYLNMT